MKNLYFIEYGCTQCTEHLIIEAKDAAAAEYYAYTSAQDCYFGYECNYIDPEDYPDATEEELVEIENEEMELDPSVFPEFSGPRQLLHYPESAWLLLPP